MPEFDELLKKIQTQTLEKSGLDTSKYTGKPYLGGNSSFVTPEQNKLSFNEITPYKMDTVYDNLSDGSRVAMFENYIPGTDNNERLAQQQTTTEKWGNGLAKFGLKTGTAVIGGTIGIVDSLITGISQGSISEGINSGVNVWLDDLNTQLDYKLPNLYTQQDRDASLFGQMGQANFYADKVFGGLSFMAGAIVSEAIWSAATVATLGGTSELLALNTAKQALNAEKWAAKALGGESKVMQVLNKAKSIVKKPVTGMLDNAIAEGSALERGGLRALSNREKQGVILSYKIGKGADIVVPMVRSALYEGSMESRMYMNQTEEAWMDKFKDQNGREPSSEEYATFKDKLTDTGNAVMFANVGILSLSNYAQFGNAILGKTSARTITNNAWSAKMFGKGFTREIDEFGASTLKAIEATKGQKIFGRVYGLGKGFVTESQEEMGQAVITGPAENYLMAGYDRDKIKSSYGLAESFGDAFAKTYTSKEGLTEGLVGGIIGLLGGSAGGIMNKVSKGDNSFFESDQELKEIKETVDYANQISQKMHINNVIASTKIQNAQQLKDQAKKTNDFSGEILADTQSGIARIERDHAIGGVQEGFEDFSRQVRVLDNEYLKEELGFETDEQANDYKEHIIQEQKTLIDSHTQNLAYAEALLGEKDFQGRKDVGEATINQLHRAMAMDLTMGEKARGIHKDISGTLADELVSLTQTEGITNAMSVQDVLELADTNRTSEIARLKVAKTNLANRLKTQQASLLKAGKIKDTEGGNQRQTALLVLTEQIQQTESEIQANEEQRQIAFNALGVDQYSEAGVTLEMLDNQEANITKFNSFMKDLAKRNPQKYDRILRLLNQQSKAIQHIKNYEKSIEAISNKTTRLKTINNWVARLFKANKELTEGQKEYFLSILENYNNDTKTVENKSYENEQRKIYEKSDKLEDLDPQFIEILKSRDESELTETDKKILGIEPEFASMEIPDRIAELEKEREEALAKVAPAIVVVEERPTEEITPNIEEINKLEKERDAKVFQASKPDLKLKLVSPKDLVNTEDPIGNKEIHDTIKEKLKNLKQLIECL